MNDQRVGWDHSLYIKNSTLQDCQRVWRFYHIIRTRAVLSTLSKYQQTLPYVVGASVANDHMTARHRPSHIHGNCYHQMGFSQQRRGKWLSDFPELKRELWEQYKSTVTYDLTMYDRALVDGAGRSMTGTISLNLPTSTSSSWTWLQRHQAFNC